MKPLNLAAALLLAVPSLALADVCTLPGELVAEDAAGDAALIAAPSPLTSHDIASLHIAEPVIGDASVEKIAVTMKVGAFDPAEPPNTSYYVRFNLNDGGSYFLSFDPYALPPPVSTYGNFTYGHVEQVAAVTNSVEDGAADAESNAAADGTITWVLTKSKIGALEEPDINNIVGEAIVCVGVPGVVCSLQTVDDTPSGYYFQVGSASCGGTSSSAKLGSGSGGMVGSMDALTLAALAWLGLLVGLRRRVSVA